MKCKKKSTRVLLLSVECPVNKNLLEKQQVMYTRLSLSDDPKAIEMKDNLRKSVSMMGFPPETDMMTLFSSMNATIKSLKDYIDD